MPKSNEENLDTITNGDKLEAINALFSLLFQEQLAEEEVECQGCEDAQDEEYEEVQEDPTTTVPVVDTINSIIARNLVRLDQDGVVLAPADLLTLAHVSHVIKLKS